MSSVSMLGCLVHGFSPPSSRPLAEVVIQDAPFGRFGRETLRFLALLIGLICAVVWSQVFRAQSATLRAAVNFITESPCVGNCMGSYTEGSLSDSEMVREGVDAEFVLNQMYKAVFGGVSPPEELVMRSAFRRRKSRCISVLRVRTTDGAFDGKEVEVYEEKRAPVSLQLKGHDGEYTAWTWDNFTRHWVDLDLDDKEAAIVDVWAVLVFNALPQVMDKLHAEVLGRNVGKELGASEGYLCLAMRLKQPEPGVEGMVTAYQIVDTKTWLPRRILIDYCNRRKTIDMSDWRHSQAVPSLLFATKLHVVDIQGTDMQISVLSVQPWPHLRKSSETAATVSQVTHAIPSELSAKIRNDFSIDPTLEPEMECPYRSPSANDDAASYNSAVKNELDLKPCPTGQLFTSARINGYDTCCWILDTGASTIVVDTSIASTLGLATFGSRNVTGIGGLVEVELAVLDRFIVGPMTISNTMVAVMDFASVQDQIDQSFAQSALGLAGGFRVAGIIGYPFFSRAIIEIRNKRRVFVHDPQQPLPLSGKQPSGPLDNHDVTTQAASTLKFIAKTPHVEAVVKGQCAAQPTQNLMLLDIGASVNMLFNAGKAHLTGLTSQETFCVNRSDRVCSGVGADQLLTKTVPMDYVEVGGIRLDRCGIKALLADSYKDFSNRGNGILGLSLFKHHVIILNYRGKQFWCRSNM